MTLILAKIALKCSLRDLKFQKFSEGRGMPPDPPRDGGVLLYDRLALHPPPPNEKFCMKSCLGF